MSNVRLRRLAADFERMQSYVRRHPRVKLVQVEGSPPEKYQLQYVVRSLRQVGGEMKVVDTHLVEIVLPRNYPRTPPQCRMLSPVFHPNIAPHAICVGDHWGAGEPLESIVVRIGEMLAYQSYNVKSPLNGDAARWVEQNLDRIPTDKVSMLAEEETAPPPDANEALPPPQSDAGSAVDSGYPVDSGYAVGPIPQGPIPQSTVPPDTQPPANTPAYPASPFDQAPYRQPPTPQFASQPQFAPPPVASPPPAAPPHVAQPPFAPQAEAAPPPGRIKVSCPGCNKSYAVPAANRGRTAKCQNCGEQFTL